MYKSENIIYTCICCCYTPIVSNIACGGGHHRWRSHFNGEVFNMLWYYRYTGQGLHNSCVQNLLGCSSLLDHNLLTLTRATCNDVSIYYTGNFYTFKEKTYTAPKSSSSSFVVSVLSSEATAVAGVCLCCTTRIPPTFTASILIQWKYNYWKWRKIMLRDIHIHESRINNWLFYIKLANIVSMQQDTVYY